MGGVLRIQSIVTLTNFFSRFVIDRLFTLFTLFTDRRYGMKNLVDIERREMARMRYYEHHLGPWNEQDNPQDILCDIHLLDEEAEDIDIGVVKRYLKNH